MGRNTKKDTQKQVVEKPKYNFQAPIKKMIATNVEVYNSVYTSRAEYTVQYTKEKALEIIANGDPDELRELSRTFFYTSGLYRMLIMYYATMLDYSTLIIPKMLGNQKPTTQVKNIYNNAMEYTDNFNLKVLFANFSIKVLVEGAYYGLVVRDGNRDTIQSLPFEYCRSRFKTADGLDIIEFNLRYFDQIYDKNKRIACLKTFPEDIRKAYNRFKNRNGPQWYLLEPGMGVHFVLFEERPFFSDIIPAIIDFAEYRGIEKDKDKQDLQKLIIQEMPHLNDGELVFEPEEVALMHQGVANMIKNRVGLDVVTSFGNMKIGDLQSSRSSVVTNNLDKISKSIYSEAGTSKEIFEASNSASLTRSLQRDSALAMYLASHYTTWFEYLLNLRFGNRNNIKFGVVLLPITCFNREDIFKVAFQGIQYGYSILVPYLCMGIPQSQVRDLKVLENDLLGLHELMKPLQSANTLASNDSQQGRDEAETNGKDLDNKKTDVNRSEERERKVESGGNNE